MITPIIKADYTEMSLRAPSLVIARRSRSNLFLSFGAGSGEAILTGIAAVVRLWRTPSQ